VLQRKDIEIDDGLFRLAAVAAAKSGLSVDAQIELWAQAGRAIETHLSQKDVMALIQGLVSVTLIAIPATPEE